MRTIRGIAWAAGVVMAAACGSNSTEPPADSKELACVNPATAGAAVTCSVKLPVAATVKAVLTSHATCEAHGDLFATTAPVADTLTTDGCFDTISKEIDLGPFDAGTTLSAEIKPGLLTGGSSGRAAVQVTGQYPTWTVKMEDALDAFAGEPNDYDDVVVTVTVTPTT
jgi:hypothetical protein